MISHSSTNNIISYVVFFCWSLHSLCCSLYGNADQLLLLLWPKQNNMDMHVSTRPTSSLSLALSRALQVGRGVMVRAWHCTRWAVLSLNEQSFEFFDLHLGTLSLLSKEQRSTWLRK